jgi:hypothetical protein
MIVKRGLFQGGNQQRREGEKETVLLKRKGGRGLRKSKRRTEFDQSTV